MIRSIRHCRLLVVLAGILIVIVTPASRAQAPMDFMKPHETEKLADGLYAFRQGAYRSLFLVGEEGVIVTDPVNPRSASEFRQAIARVTDRPVKYVVYSHSHWDRIAGGRVFKDEGARFVAHQRCAENLRETPNPDVIMPDITYSETYSVRSGDKSLDLYYFGPSLDNCLSVMVARPAKMMMIVNLVNPPAASMPWNPTVPDYRLYNIVPFFRAVEDLARRDGIGTVVGGFISVGAGPTGKPVLLPATGPISVVSDQRMFWEKLLAAVKPEVEAGTPSRDIWKKIDLAEFSRYPRYSERGMAILTRRVASVYVIGQ